MQTYPVSWKNDQQLSSVGDKSRYYVLFRIARQIYALPLTQVVRVLRMVAFTPVPEMPAWLSGVINVAGQTLAVVDLRHLLGQQSREPQLQDRLLMIESQRQVAAFAVDEVLSIQEFTDAQIEPPNPALSQSHVLAAMVHQDDTLVMVLDAHRVFFERLEKVRAT